MLEVPPLLRHLEDCRQAFRRASAPPERCIRRCARADCGNAGAPRRTAFGSPSSPVVHGEVYRAWSPPANRVASSVQLLFVRLDVRRGEEQAQLLAFRRGNRRTWRTRPLPSFTSEDDECKARGRAAKLVRDERRPAELA